MVLHLHNAQTGFLRWQERFSASALFSLSSSLSSSPPSKDAKNRGTKKQREEQWNSRIAKIMTSFGGINFSQRLTMEKRIEIWKEAQLSSLFWYWCHRMRCDASSGQKWKLLIRGSEEKGGKRWPTYPITCPTNRPWDWADLQNVLNPFWAAGKGKGDAWK